MFRLHPSGFITADGHAVGHPVLQNIPFERSIEPWVRDYFPDAEYVQVEDPHLKALPAPLPPGMVVLQAAKGMGKSKCIRAAMSALAATTSVVQVTFRRTLATSSRSMLGPDAVVYNDAALGTGSINARRHPRLTIVVNSIGRIRGAYDVVVIDEVVSVLDALAGDLIPADRRVDAVATLAALISDAKTVIIADAMLDATCVHFVRMCRGSVPTPLLVLDYVHRIHHDYTYVAHAGTDT